MIQKHIYNDSPNKNTYEDNHQNHTHRGYDTTMDCIKKLFNNTVYSEHVPNAFLTETSLQCIMLSLEKWDTLNFQSFIDRPSESS